MFCVAVRQAPTWLIPMRAVIVLSVRAHQERRVVPGAGEIWEEAVAVSDNRLIRRPRVITIPVQ